jgi:alpha-beta hydrolase superfamily lysophospholipase
MLGGTIVFPVGAGPFPGIVFLHGSGAEGRWASRYLAHEFARRGVAALIYDKRGVGRSTGDWRTASFVDLVGDAVAAVEALRSQLRVASDRVGIHGHSQGGTIAPWVASKDQHVAFVVASAAGGGSMADMEILLVVLTQHRDL